MRRSSPTADPGRLLARAGAWALVVGVVQFFVLHLVVQAAWPEPYSWTQNNISDLGAAGCGPWERDGRYVCSPLHDWMNASFVLQGVLLLVGVVLAASVLRDLVTRTSGVLLCLAGLGWVLAGAAPADTNEGLHVLGAFLIFFCGNLALLFAERRGQAGRTRRILTLSLPLGAGGLVATALFLGQVYPVLGMGGMERLAVFPLQVWVFLVGVHLLRTSTKGRRAQPSSECNANVARCLLVPVILWGLLSLAVDETSAAKDRIAEGGPDIESIDAYVEEQMEDKNLPGAAIAITRGGEVLHVRGYGETSTGQPVTGDTKFRVASLSKSFTSLAVMQLAEDGKVELDEPVEKYLPAFRVDDPRSGKITVRQLLDQSSGMTDGGFPELSRPQPDSLAEAVERLRHARLVADPGTRWNYHNPNYQVAARLVEVVGGEPFDEYLDRRVFGPLGMDRSTTTAKDDERVAGLDRGHSFAYGKPHPVPDPGYFVAGSGGVVSTASDMARWLVAQNNGGVGPDGARVVSEQSIDEMHTPRGPGDYALGWDMEGPKLNPTRIAHGGCCFAWAADQSLLTEGDYGVAILFNSASPIGIDQGNVTEGVISLVQDDAPEEGPSSSTVDLVLGGLTLIVLVLGTIGTLRAHRWAARRVERQAWSTGLRLLPHLALLAACLCFPTLAGFLFGGRDVTWFSTAYNWFALLVLVAVVALVEAVVIVTRLHRLARLRRKPHAGSAAAAGTM